eukprot:scaffold9388_cov148-Skeletonema_marinoi.AAC.8
MSISQLQTSEEKPSSFGLWLIIALAGALLAGVVSSSARNNQDTARNNQGTSPPEDDGWLRGQVLLAWLIK